MSSPYIKNRSSKPSTSRTAVTRTNITAPLADTMFAAASEESHRIRYRWDLDQHLRTYWCVMWQMVPHSVGKQRLQRRFVG